MRQPNAPIMVNVSMAADAVSEPILMKQGYICAIQAVWSGSPVGDFTIETSCDAGAIDPVTGDAIGITNWVFYHGSTQAAGGSTGVFTWRLNSVPEDWVRLKYTRTSGSGTVNARFNAKGV